jgi:hypothetical protein
MTGGLQNLNSFLSKQIKTMKTLQMLKKSDNKQQYLLFFRFTIFACQCVNYGNNKSCPLEVILNFLSVVRSLLPGFRIYKHRITSVIF